MINKLCKALGYENSFFLCSEYTSTDGLNNICKAIVSGGFWVTFLNLQSLSTSLMSSLSSVLTQISDRKESILINNETVRFVYATANATTNPKNGSQFAFFGSIEATNDTYLANSLIDSLKITKIDHYFNLISKDLLDKFKILNSTNLDENSNLKNFIQTNLILKGFRSFEQLTDELVMLSEVYLKYLKVMIKRNDSKQDTIDPFLISNYIREASCFLFNNKIQNHESFKGDSFNLNERNAIAITFANAIFPRLGLNSSKMMLSFLKNVWPDVIIPERFRLSVKNNVKFLNLPLYMEKETCMQLEDKTVLTEMTDAVFIATTKLKLASSVLFQSKAVSVIENLKSFKNLLLIGKK
jgi:hypothetical protein